MTRSAVASALAGLQLVEAAAAELPVLVIPRKASHRAVVTMLLRVGSRFESRADNGVSHFLEHMLYRGSASNPTAHDLALAFERLGGTLYAATQSDHGTLAISLPPENLEPACRLFADVVRSPRFSDIEIERDIVREEILEDLDDDGRQIDADNLVRALMYKGHPLGFTITGSLRQLASFDVPALERHHARHYTGTNAALCFTGAVDPDACVRLARELFSDMPKGPRVTVAPPPPPQDAPRLRLVENVSSQTDLRIAFRAVGDHDPREPAAEMLLRVLDDGMSTRLYERICDAKGLCYDVSALHESYEDDGVFDVAAECRHARAPEVLGEVLGLLADLAEHGPTEAELDKARDRDGWQMRALLDDAEGLAHLAAMGTIARIARTPAERHRELAAATRAEVRDAAAAIFRPQGMSVVAVGMADAAAQRAIKKALASFGR